MHIIKSIPLLFFVLFSVASLSKYGTKNRKILRGNQTKSGDFKYMVAIMLNGNFTCGGGIIGERLILSAAHCFVDPKTNEFTAGNFTVLAGTNDIYDDRHTRRVEVVVEKIIVPQSYEAESDKDDITVIRLKTRLDVEKNDLQILSTAESGNYKNIAVIAGFGHYKLINDNVNNTTIGHTDGKLHSADVQVIKNEECVPIFHENKNIICGFMLVEDDLEPYGLCNDDSGSPLVVESNLVIGIVSNADHVCDENLNLFEDEPIFYTNVTAHSDFIKEAKVIPSTYSASTAMGVRILNNK